MTRRLTGGIGRDRGPIGVGRERGPGDIGRRTALLLPLAALGGCSLFDDLFSDTKTPLPGKREPVMTTRRGLEGGETQGVAVVLPPAVTNAAWPQAGGNPAHLMGHLAAGERLSEAWRRDIGEGGGYRKKILAAPVVAGGTVFAMDSSGVVSAFEVMSGKRLWRFDTVSDDEDSTNVGGGLGFDDGRLYAVNGLGDLFALDAAKGSVRWKRNIGSPARSAPTIADGRLFLITLQEQLLACAVDDGRQLWAHQAATSTVGMLGQPAPAYADGLVVAGFGSGELACVRASTGSVAWTDSLAAARGRNSLSDLSAIRGRPVVSDGRVFAISLGRLMLSLDLRSGRRLWERDVAGQDDPWVAGDWMFVVSEEQQLAAVSRFDGRVAWVTDLPRWDNPEKHTDPLFWFGPLLAGDRLVVAGTNGDALAISPYSGEILGRQKLSAAASLGPIVAGGTVFVVTDDGALLALR